MSPQDAFAVLGLPITASETEVKAAYRRLVAVYHPDRGHEAGPAAAERMRGINEAYAAARATWHRTESRASKPIYAPPKPPPRPVAPIGPEPPPLHEDSLRVQLTAAERAEAERRAAVIADLRRVGFLDPHGDPRRGDPVVDAFLPLLSTRDHLRACHRYADWAVAGEPPERASTHHFTHAVPSAAQGNGRPRSEAIERLALSHVVACTSDRVLWTFSRLVDDGGLLMREDIDAYAAPFDHVRTVRETDHGVEIILAQGSALAFRLEPGAAADLAATVVGGA